VVQKALGGWQADREATGLQPLPPIAGGQLALVHRAGAVQSQLRLSAQALPRTDPGYPALQLANLIFGGFFSSRWVENIREDKGYTYGPHSVVEHSIAGSSLILSAEVATDVTGPALLETWYELGRISTVVPGEDELEQARQYALGSLLLGMSTQAGLAGLASTYAGYGLRLDFLARHAAALASASRDAVAAAAGTYLAPTRGVTVVLGDAGLVESSLGRLSPVDRDSNGAGRNGEGSAGAARGGDDPPGADHAGAHVD
jgi:predicted Zn-dependent peptidase